jgi:hypothetical protein
MGGRTTLSGERWCSHWTWWINHPSLSRSPSDRILMMRQPRQACPSQREAPSELFCGYLHPFPHHVIQLLLASRSLKRKAAARGRRAPRMLSIVDGFCRLPSPVCAVDSAVPPIGLLVLAAAPVPLAVRHEGGRNGSRRATTLDGPTGVETAAPLPRCDERARLPHV